ncbi:MAG TPA: response regulator [Gemmatimonadaceae bacterium]|nr:response regulator [Gemmatimonadaceae bacterium]
MDLYFADGRIFGSLDRATGAVHDVDGRYRGWVEPDGAVYRADGQYAGQLSPDGYDGYVLREVARPAPPPREPRPPAPRRPSRPDHANRGTLRLLGTGMVDGLRALAAPDPEGGAPDESAAPPRGDVPRRQLVVLVATEDPARCRAVGEVLSAAGYAVLEACSGDDALAAARGRVGPVDLLVADLHLPGEMTGAALARRLTGWHPGLRALFLDGPAPDGSAAEPRGFWARLAPAAPAPPARPAAAGLPPNAEEEEGETYAVLRTPVKGEELVRAVRAVLGRE